MTDFEWAIRDVVVTRVGQFPKSEPIQWLARSQKSDPTS
ncbi:hypothetical protein SAMN05519103_03992 [Rhizobiales bacterium GAS113]|nr:hypothetical protein SAMN05519103_03992 [Rhizobiales bacterium GAS113]